MPLKRLRKRSASRQLAHTWLKHSEALKVIRRHLPDTAARHIQLRRNERCEGWMSAKRLAARWFLRVGVATAILSGIGFLANPGNAMAAELPPVQDMAPAASAAIFFAAALFVATLRIGRVHGRGCLAWVSRTSRVTRGEDRIPAPSTAGQAARVSR
jgi:hypothetical protein